jgi:hypothetical protein
MSQSEMKVDNNGTKYWYLGNNLHREDGPAVEFINGEKYWYLNNQLHREDGPAFEWADGTKHWYLNGNRVPWQEVFKKAKTQEQELCIIIHASG